MTNNAIVRDPNKALRARAESVTTWPEAIHLQAQMYRNETRMFPPEPGENDFFSEAADACDRALVLWREEYAKRADAISELETRIANLKAGVRHEVADRLKGETYGRVGWINVAKELAAAPEDGMQDWLNW